MLVLFARSTPGSCIRDQQGSACHPQHHKGCKSPSDVALVLGWRRWENTNRLQCRRSLVSILRGGPSGTVRAGRNIGVIRRFVGHRDDRS